MLGIRLMKNQSYRDNADKFSNAKAIRAALEKMCYELAPEPIAEEIKESLSFQVFPSLLTLKELRRVTVLADKYDLDLIKLREAYKTLRDMYWENKLQKKHDKGNDYDFLKEIGVKW